MLYVFSIMSYIWNICGRHNKSRPEGRLFFLFLFLSPSSRGRGIGFSLHSSSQGVNRATSPLSVAASRIEMNLQVVPAGMRFYRETLTLHPIRMLPSFLWS